MLPVHTAIFLDTRRALNDGTYPVKLRITYQRQRQYYNMNYALTADDFAKTQGDKPRGKYNLLRVAFTAVEQRAIQIIEKLSVFSFESFRKNFYNINAREDVFAALDQTAMQLKEAGQGRTCWNLWKCLHVAYCLSDQRAFNPE